MIDYGEFTAQVREWGRRVTNTIKGNAPALKDIKARVKTNAGAPQRISFTFPRYYVFREKGVGRGRAIGSGKETPKPDINPAIADALPELGDIAANGFADAVAKGLFID